MRGPRGLRALGVAVVLGVVAVGCGIEVTATADPHPLRVGEAGRICAQIGWPTDPREASWEITVTLAAGDSSSELASVEGTIADTPCVTVTPSAAGVAHVNVLAAARNENDYPVSGGFQGDVAVIDPGAQATQIRSVTFSPEPVRQESPVTVCADIAWGPGEPGTGTWRIDIQPGSSIGEGTGTDLEAACVTSAPVPRWTSVTVHVMAARGGTFAETRQTATVVSAGSTRAAGEGQGPLIRGITVSPAG